MGKGDKSVWIGGCNSVWMSDLRYITYFNWAVSPRTTAAAGLALNSLTAISSLKRPESAFVLIAFRRFRCALQLLRTGHAASRTSVAAKACHATLESSSANARSASYRHAQLAMAHETSPVSIETSKLVPAPNRMS